MIKVTVFLFEILLSTMKIFQLFNEVIHRQFFLFKVPEGCEILADPPNPGFNKGCRGAVNLNGSPSKDYCKNDDRYPWFQNCCKWVNDDCVPKSMEEGMFSCLTHKGLDIVNRRCAERRNNFYKITYVQTF